MNRRFQSRRNSFTTDTYHRYLDICAPHWFLYHVSSIPKQTCLAQKEDYQTGTCCWLPVSFASSSHCERWGEQLINSSKNWELETLNSMCMCSTLEVSCPCLPWSFRHLILWHSTYNLWSTGSSWILAWTLLAPLKEMGRGWIWLYQSSSCRRIHINSLTHTLGISRWRVITNPSYLHTLVCFPQCNRLYLVSFGVIPSSSGQVICHISALQSEDVWDTKVTLRYMQRHAQTYHFSSWGKFPNYNIEALLSRWHGGINLRSSRWFICTPLTAAHICGVPVIAVKATVETPLLILSDQEHPWGAPQTKVTESVKSGEIRRTFKDEAKHGPTHLFCIPLCLQAPERFVFNKIK